MFDFSRDYRENVICATVVIWCICGLIFGVSMISTSHPPEQFVTSVSQTNQPNCVLGAYIMFAKERLHEELLIKNTEQKYPILASQNVTFGTVKSIWDDMFPSNKLQCVFDCSKEDSLTNKIEFSKPYLWVGKWEIDINNQMNHACLVYFHSNSVTFKHFVYNPKTRYNYYVKTNYEFFSKSTSFLFQLK